MEFSFSPPPSSGENGMIRKVAFVRFYCKIEPSLFIVKKISHLSAELKKREKESNERARPISMKTQHPENTPFSVTWGN